MESAVKGGSLAWADYDTDGNPDLAVSGRDISWISVLQLYKNRPAGVLSLDGNFNLNVISTLDGALDWIDYDNDGFIDREEWAGSDAVFYSDSITDLPLLEHVGTAVVVNPDARLRRVARARGWPIERW